MDSIDLEVLKTSAAWIASGRRCELITVIKTWGSSPRPVGATLGIRPEPIQLVASGTAGAVTGKVKLVEPMGAHQILWVDCQGQTMSIHTESSTSYHAGDSLNLAVDCARASIFQGDGESRL